MEHSEFRSGLEFWFCDRQWRCTDIGTRVIVAIRVDSAELATSHSDRSTTTQVMTRTEAEEAGCFNGPPYTVLESVFDEYDLEGCSLEP